MSDINETEIRVFADAVNDYFSQITAHPSKIRAAYLGETHSVIPSFDLTGAINVSGRFRGTIRFSAPRAMIRHLLVSMREPNQSDENLLDTVGELANTLAGNARRHFGEDMDISVPVTHIGDAQAVDTVRMRPYVIMVNWKHYDASLVVDLKRLD